MKRREIEVKKNEEKIQERSTYKKGYERRLVRIEDFGRKNGKTHHETRK